MSAITKTAASTSFVSTYEEVTRVRIEDPGRFARLAAARKRRTVADTDGTMMIIAADHPARGALGVGSRDRKSTRLNSSHVAISYAVFCLKKKMITRARYYCVVTET